MACWRRDLLALSNATPQRQRGIDAKTYPSGDRQNQSGLKHVHTPRSVHSASWQMSTSLDPAYPFTIDAEILLQADRAIELIWHQLGKKVINGHEGREGIAVIEQKLGRAVRQVVYLEERRGLEHAARIVCGPGIEAVAQQVAKEHGVA